MASRKRSSFDSFPTAEPRAPRRRRGRADSSDVSRYSRQAYENSTPPTSAAEAYSRRAARAEYARARAKQRRGKRITMVLGIVLSLVLVGAGAAWAYVNVLNGKLGADLGNELDKVLYDMKSPDDPFYALLMGVDKSAARQNSDKYAGDNFRSDSMMLVRVDPKKQIVTLVSIVRDTYVDMGENGYQKINAAHAIGGAPYTVEVVSEFAGVPISHYVEIDFDGFKAAVDALGGIDVNVPIAIHDSNSGASLEPGEQTLNGDQALALCRSRHAYDSYGAGDFYRAANQRMVMGAVADKLLDSDVGTIVKTTTALCDYISTDMTVDEIVGVAVALQGMDTKTNIYSTMNPTISTYEYGGWYEYSNNEAWQAMMQRIDQGLPPTVNAADSANNGGVLDGTVDADYVAKAALEDSGNTGGTPVTGIEVWNGSGISGTAAKMSGALMSLGYNVTATTDAPNYDYQETLIIYGKKSQKSAAEDLAASLGVGTPTFDDSYPVADGGLIIVLGADYY